MSKSSKTQGSTAQTQAANQTATPYNQGWLAQGLNVNTGTLNGTSGNNQNINLINQGLGLVGQGGNTSSAAATGGLNTATALANGGTANNANQFLTPFANGSMSGANPQFQQLIDHIGQVLQPQVDGQFGAAGRYGSGANANAFASALTNEAGALGYQNYGDSLNRQQQAADQLSANNTNSTGQSINALGQIAPLGGAATGAGDAQIAAGQQPLNNFAKVMAMLGAGGGTQSGMSSGTGTTNSTTSSSSPLQTIGGIASILALL